MKQDTAKKKENTERGILLDPERKSPRAAEFEDKLSAQIATLKNLSIHPIFLLHLLNMVL